MNMKMEPYRKTLFSLLTISVIMFSVGLNELNAQYSIKWMNVGNFHSCYSTGMALREGEPYRNAAGQWPSIDYHSGSICNQGFWMGATNFTDQDGRFFEYKVSHLGPRAGGAIQNFPVTHTIKSKFNPEITVDGKKSFEKYAFIDEVDATMKADREMTVVNNNVLGVTTTQTISAFSQEGHDNYHIIEFVFTNTGNVDADEDIELPNNDLTGVIPFFIHRYAMHEASSWVRGGGSTWGKFTMNDAVGDGHEDYDVDFRAQYSWAGLNPDNTNFNSLGGPLMFGHWATQSYDTTGRLAAAQMIGRVFLHSPGTPGGADDPAQPFTMGVMGSDDPNLADDEFNETLMSIQYNTYMTSGRLYPHHADDIEPEGNFDTPTNAPNVYDGVYDEGGWSIIEGYGPYDLPAGESINITVAEAVDGLSMKAKYDLGKLYRATGATTPDDAALLEYNGHSMTKNQWVLTSKDSLFRAFEAAKANYESGYNIPEAPYPPATFDVVSGTDKISLTWTAMSGGPSRTGWEIYRAKSHFHFPLKEEGHDGLGHILLAELGAGETSYDDVSANRGVNYYYHIVAVGNASDNDGSAHTPPGALKSNMFWTQTYLPAGLKRSAGASMADIRVVPNPFHLGSEADVRWPDKKDKLGFLDIPGQCTIKIYTQLGELINTIVHTDGSGDEYWDHTTSSRQVIASGLYIAHITDDETGDTAERKFVIVR